MTTPKSTKKGKWKQPVHNISPSNVAEKKKRGSSPNQCEVCIVCDCAILEPSEFTEGQNVVLSEGKYQGWIHCSP